MSQALHSGFDQIDCDPVRRFLRVAPDLLAIGTLVEAFGAALTTEQATGHHCFAVDGNGRQILLTRSREAGAASSDGESPVIFSIDMPDDQPLVLTIDTAEPPDRHRRARLHALAVVYATHVAVLIEAQDDMPSVGSLTPIERRCLRLVLAGLSHLDIGEQLDLSAPAVGIYVRRAAARLGVRSPREACTIALARGLLN